jgi:hypothetical protein
MKLLYNFFIKFNNYNLQGRVTKKLGFPTGGIAREPFYGRFGVTPKPTVKSG